MAFYRQYSGFSVAGNTSPGVQDPQLRLSENVDLLN